MFVPLINPEVAIFYIYEAACVKTEVPTNEHENVVDSSFGASIEIDVIYASPDHFLSPVSDDSKQTSKTPLVVI